MGRLTQWVWPVVGGALTGLAFLFPETLPSLVLGWLAVFVIAFCSDSDVRWRGWSILGAVLGLIGFYWIPYTLKLFGGFPDFVALLLFLLFTLTISLQLVLAAVAARALDRITFFTRTMLSFPLAWFAVEYLFPRLFPWTISHTQIVWASFASLASLVPVELLTALMLWVAVFLVRLIRRGSSGIPAYGWSSTIVFSLLLLWGWRETAHVKQDIKSAPMLRIGLIQGNLDVFEKRNALSLAANLEKHRVLSREAVADGAEILFWPESVLATWVPLSIHSFRGKSFDPYPDASVPLMVGGLSYERRPEEEYRELVGATWGEMSPEYKDELRAKRFNTAFGISAAGELLGFYHKKVLMPFGEYLPFARVVPAIQQLSPLSGDFDSGALSEPIAYQLKVQSREGAEVAREVKVMPLVCYEDLIPSLSREAVKRGSSLLVNLTNDAWYGKSVAPYEHHLLAQWRAIETRRSLLRVTNTGLTAIVNPLGRTEASLSIFSSGKLVQDVPLLSRVTPFVVWGEFPFKILAWAVLFCAICWRYCFSKMK